MLTFFFLILANNLVCFKPHVLNHLLKIGTQRWLSSQSLCSAVLVSPARCHPGGSGTWTDTCTTVVSQSHFALSPVFPTLAQLGNQPVTPPTGF